MWPDKSGSSGGGAVTTPGVDTSALMYANPNAHRYWRVLATAGDFIFSGLNFRQVAGVATNMTALTPIGSNFVFGSAFLLDGDMNSAGGTAGGGNWYGVDYGVGNSKLVVEVAITPKYGDGRAPSAGKLQWSDDYSVWNDSFSFTAAAWVDGVAQIFTDPAAATKIAAGTSPLMDVVIATPADGQVLKYDAASGKWKNASGAASLSTISDGALVTPTVGEGLVHNGTKWVNGKPGLNGISFVAEGAGWNPSDKAANIVLSNSNLTAAFVDNSWVSVFGTPAKSSGKWYFEVTFLSGTVNDAAAIGVAPVAVGPNGRIGVSEATAVGLSYSGSIYRDGFGQGNTGLSYGVGTVIGVALDVATRKIWFRRDGGAWNNDAVNHNPVTGLGGTVINGAGSLKLGVSNNAVATVSINMNASGAPTGFTAWGSTGLVPSLSDVAVSNVTDKQLMQYDATEGKWKNAYMPYQVGAFFSGKPAASDVLAQISIAAPVSFAINMAGSAGRSKLAAAAQYDINVQKTTAAGVVSSVGTLRIAASGTVISFIAASAFTCAAGDLLEFIGSATPDSTVSDISWTLVGTRI